MIRNENIKLHSHSRDIPKYWLTLGLPLMAAIFIGCCPAPATDCLSNFRCESRPEKAQDRSLSVPINTNKTEN